MKELKEIHKSFSHPKAKKRGKAQLEEKIKNLVKGQYIKDLIELSIKEESGGRFQLDFYINKNLNEKAPAETLKKIEGRSCLVVGHTTRVGSEESQYILSVERVRVIVDYLVSQGLGSRALYLGGRGRYGTICLQ